MRAKWLHNTLYDGIFTLFLISKPQLYYFGHYCPFSDSSDFFNVLFINMLRVWHGFCISMSKIKSMDREISKEEKAKVTRKLIIRATIVLLAVSAAIAGISFFLEPTLPVSALTIAEVDSGDIEITVNASGRLVPQNEEIIISPINSRILEVYKNPGDTVDIDEPLLRLDLSATETEYAKKLDEREKLKSRLIQTEIKLENNVFDLEMQQQIKQMQVKQFQVDLTGEKHLDSIGASTTDKVQRAQLNYDEAMLELKQLDEKIRNERRNSAAEMNVQELEYRIFEKELAQSSRLLKDARVLSPGKATLTFIANQIGMQVTQGAQIAVVSDLSRFNVEAEAADSYADRISLGAKAMVEIGRERLVGTVVNITPASSGGLLKFVVMLSDSDNAVLRSGLRTDVYVQHGLRAGVLRIPNGRYYKGKGIHELWVINGNKAEKRNVSLGESNYEYVEIASGLQQGDKVIISDMDNYENKYSLKLK